ncbi:hypothetical protein BDZ89DRAFT_1076165 [Hymenopellis radicata]|nr:hypothetical protein BDZ89DRAFT_1076165 [Hymenopellis radicata]
MPPRRSQRISGSTKAKSSTARSASGKNKAIIAQPANKRRKLALTALTLPDDSEDEDTEEEDVDDSDAEKDVTPPTKQGGQRDTTAPARKRYVKGKRGILQKITDTPLDVLFEIFSYLEPLDLLRLGRTTKDLRALLMSKSSAFVWERARLAMKNLPPFLDDLTEPQYANLLFDSSCHECGKHTINTVQWEARLRLCKHCLQDGSIMTADEDYLVDLSSRYRDLMLVTPKYILTGQRLTLIYFHLPAYRRLAEECSSMNDQSFQVWISNKGGEYSALVQGCRAYQRWSSLKKYGRNSELRSLRRERMTSIIHRLEADGWSDELRDFDTLMTLEKHKLVRQSKALTERIWTNICPTLTKVVSDARTAILTRKINTAISRRVASLQELCKPLLAKMSEREASPSASMIPRLEPFFSLIKNTPFELDITTADFSEALESLPDTCALWRRQRDADLKKILLKNDHSDNLALAMNTFTCKSSSCLALSNTGLNTSVNVWDPQSITTVTGRLREDFEDIIRMCGLDPAVATAEDMDAVQAFFIEAEGACSRVRVMDWRGAMGYVKEHPATRVKRVSDAHLISRAQILNAFDLAAELNSEFRTESFVCVHCDMTDLSSRDAREWHLISGHNIPRGSDPANHFRRSLKYGYTFTKHVGF